MYLYFFSQVFYNPLHPFVKGDLSAAMLHYMLYLHLTLTQVVLLLVIRCLLNVACLASSQLIHVFPGIKSFDEHSVGLP